MESQTRPSIFQGILLAAFLTAVALAGAFIGSVVIYGTPLLMMLISGVAFLYLCFILRAGKGQSGRVVLGVASAVYLAFCAGWLTFGSFILSVVLLIWMVRSLTTYSSLIFAGVDGLLCAGGLLAGIAAWTYSGSAAVGLWCFFLVQSLYVIIPRNISECRRGSRKDSVRREGDEAFDTAFRAAEEIFRGAGIAN